MTREQLNILQLIIELKGHCGFGDEFGDEDNHICHDCIYWRTYQGEYCIPDKYLDGKEDSLCDRYCYTRAKKDLLKYIKDLTNE